MSLALVWSVLSGLAGVASYSWVRRARAAGGPVRAGSMGTGVAAGPVLQPERLCWLRPARRGEAAPRKSFGKPTYFRLLLLFSILLQSCDQIQFRLN